MDYSKIIARLDDLVSQRERDFVQMVKTSYSEETKKSKEYYLRMIEIRKDAWRNAMYLRRIVDRIYNRCENLQSLLDNTKLLPQVKSPPADIHKH